MSVARRRMLKGIALVKLEVAAGHGAIAAAVSWSRVWGLGV